MKKYIFLGCTILFTTAVTTAQKIENPKTQQLADLSFGFGNKQGSVVAGYFYNWNIGKSKKFFIGTGVRFNTFYGTNVNFTSAPSSLAGDKLKVINKRANVTVCPSLVTASVDINRLVRVGTTYTSNNIQDINF